MLAKTPYTIDSLASWSKPYHLSTMVEDVENRVKTRTLNDADEKLCLARSAWIERSKFVLMLADATVSCCWARHFLFTVYLYYPCLEMGTCMQTVRAI